ncbi:hypothetical protein GP486_003466 [Trichoglossum hirsutum]|uniref:Ras-GAP domain-containing protein n=1 Tax=Trichoglossum hirsutum TaxID=265104 RepID=A0A9P8LD03_9PEZI|nr:hypothetical protein GP486_003466 [Trichoglossum hirsutum]
MDTSHSRGSGSERMPTPQERTNSRTIRYSGSTSSLIEAQGSRPVRFQDLTIRTVTPESIQGVLENASETHISPSGPPRSDIDEESKNRITELPAILGWNGNSPIVKSPKESSVRPRTRTLEGRPRDSSPSSPLSGTRQTIGSVHTVGPTTFQEQRDTVSPALAGSIRHQTKSSPSPSPPIQPSQSATERTRIGGRRHLANSALRSGSPGTSPPSIGDSLPSPMPTEDANKILQLMKTTCGRMQGNLEFRTGVTAPWSSGYCFINEESGSLVSQKRDGTYSQRTLVPDLRGCQIKKSSPRASQTAEIEISTYASRLEVQIRPDPDQFDSWFAALLCWQPIRPKGAQNKVMKPQLPFISERRLGDRRRNSDSPVWKDAAIIKVGKMLLWEKDNFAKLMSSPLSTSQGQQRPSCHPGRKVSCILQENGEFKLYTESDVTLLSVIQLSQLSRCAVQQLDRTVLDEEFSIGIYPQYTSTSTSLSLIRPIYLTLESRVLFEVWFVLLRAFTIPELYGPKQMHDEETLNSPIAMRGLFLASTTDMFRVERSLSLRIVEAKLGNPRPRTTPEPGLRGRLSGVAGRDSPAADYFCEVWLDGEVRAKTMLKSNTSNPFWREDYEFFDLPAVLSKTSIILKKKERRSAGSDGVASSASSGAIGVLAETGEPASGPSLDVTHGKLEIELDDLDYGKETEGWWPLVNQRGENIGEMLVRLRAEEMVVLMSRDYQPLSELLHEFSSGLTLQIARMIPSELRRLSETLLDIFQVSGQASEWLMALVEEEIDGLHKEPSASRLRFSGRVGSNDSNSTSDREILIHDLRKSATVEANLLFRGNSLLTKSLDIQMKRLGKEYLEETLCERLQEIQECDLDCEVDPARVQSTDELDKNWQNLFRLTEGIWDSISQSSSRCPTELRKIFRHIRACAEDRYGDFLRTIIYSSVSGFLFLRFFCPAVLNPKLFGLLRGKPLPPPAITASA